MLNNKQIHNLLSAIKEHPDRHTIMKQLENVISEELDLNVPRLIDAILLGDADAAVHAFTGWDLQALLEKAMIIPHTSGAWSINSMMNLYQDKVVFQNCSCHEDI